MVGFTDYFAEFYERKRDAVAYISTAMANDIVVMDGMLGVKLSQAAAQRKVSVETWWETLMDQAPTSLRQLPYGTKSWAIMAIYYALIPPNAQWTKYRDYIARLGRDAMSEMSIPVPSDIPDDKNSCLDLIALSVNTSSASKKDMYGASYHGMYKACFVLASYFGNHRDHDMARLYKAGGMLWSFRSRCTQSVVVRLTDPRGDDPTHSQTRIVDFREPLGRRKVCVTIAPYKAFEALIKGLDSINVLTGVDPNANVVGRVSDALASLPFLATSDNFPFMDSPTLRTRLTKVDFLRYLFDLQGLARDIEEYLRFAVLDATKAVDGILDKVDAKRQEAIAAELAIREEHAQRVRECNIEGLEGTFDIGLSGAMFAAPSMGGQDGWAYYSNLDEDYAEIITEACGEDDVDAMDLMETEYDSYNDFLRAVEAYLRVPVVEKATSNTLA